MTSPLLPYANSYLLINAPAAPAIEQGRITQQPGTNYLVRCYLKRQDSTGTTTGADYLPARGGTSDVLPGSSGEVYLYRGYALLWAAAPEGYEPGQAVPTTLAWTPLTPATKPSWLSEGSTATQVQGLETPKVTTIERCTGKYGGTAIDEIISREIAGIPITLRSGDLTR